MPRPYTPPDMSLDPTERLEELRRQVAAETPATPQPSIPEPPPTTQPGGSIPIPTASSTSSTPEPPGPEPPAPDAGDGWDLQELLADASLRVWLGVGLLAVGGYMVLSWFVPGLDLIGSIIILGAGVVLLVQHFQRGAGAWALYAGAVLTGMGAGRAIGDILPGSPHGLTAIGVGLAFLAISYLRHTQAGGYGWQGVMGGAALGLGLVQFVLGLLPGSPSAIDLILPALLLVGGGLLLARSRGRSAND